MDTAYCAGQLEKLVNFDVGSRGVIERHAEEVLTALLELRRRG